MGKRSENEAYTPRCASSQEKLKKLKSITSNKKRAKEHV